MHKSWLNTLAFQIRYGDWKNDRVKTVLRSIDTNTVNIIFML